MKRSSFKLVSNGKNYELVDWSDDPIHDLGIGPINRLNEWLSIHNLPHQRTEKWMKVYDDKTYTLGFYKTKIIQNEYDSASPQDTPCEITIIIDFKKKKPRI